jgi:hypothetical protein
MAPLLTEEHKRRFEADGFLILDRFLDAGTVERLRARFEPLFKGEFETGLYPDEWNWQEGRDRPDRTRQICNGWNRPHGRESGLSAEIGRMWQARAGPARGWRRTTSSGSRRAPGRSASTRTTATTAGLTRRIC